MTSRRYDAADALMLTGMPLQCPDCGDERIFVAPESGESTPGWVDYVCTDCGAAVSLLAVLAEGSPASRSARTA